MRHLRLRPSLRPLGYGPDTPLARIVRAAGDLLLPRCCAGCDLSLAPGTQRLGWCPACLDALTAPAGRCPCCGLRGSHDLCITCRRDPPAFDGTIVLTDYAPPVDRLIHALKFGRDFSLARPLGALVAQRLALADFGKGSPAPTHVTAIPLSVERLANRGFNQSLELARAVSAHSSLALDRHALRRVREVTAQSQLGNRERRLNTLGLFSAANQTGRHVIVVDDVMTTGATLAAAALALKGAGAVRVTNLIIARTPEQDVQRRSGPA